MRNTTFWRLGSVAGPVIQATGKSEFEDGLRPGDFVSDFSCCMSVRTRLPDQMSRPNSQANGLAMLKTPVPLDHGLQLTSGPSVIGWVTAQSHPYVQLQLICCWPGGPVLYHTVRQ